MVLPKSSVRKRRKGESKSSIQQLFIGLITVTVFLYVVAFLNLQNEDNHHRATTTTANATPLLKRKETFTKKQNDQSQFYLAQEQSLNFFKDITESDWKLQQDSFQEKSQQLLLLNHGVVDHKQNLRVSKNNHEFESEFTCSHARRLGGTTKWLCDPHRIVPSADERSYTTGKMRCLVYNVVGSNNDDNNNTGDTQFEESVRDALLPNCKKGQLEIHTFDVNDRTKEYVDRLKAVGGTFHHWGVTTSDQGNIKRSMFKTFGQTFQELGHSFRILDILKIDCEGCEWQSLEGWLKDWKEGGVTVRQLLLKLDASPVERTLPFFELLQKHHYVMTHQVRTGGTVEYTFLKLAASFFQK